MLGDVKYALRQLRKSPGFTVTAILTLALGIGANAVVFSVLNAVVLRPLNVPHAQNLYMVQRLQYPSQSYQDYVDLRDRNRSFESLYEFNIIGAVGMATGGGTPSTTWPYLASGNYFDALGIQPYLGRFFHANDEHGTNSAPYVVLSYATWQSKFAGDRGVVGRAVEINGHPYTIIGVAPPAFRGTELFFAPGMWIPMVQGPQIEGFDFLRERGDHSGFVEGRLKAGVTPAQATADANAIGAWLAKAYPHDDDGVNFTLVRPGLLGDMLGRPARAFIAGLMLLAGLILLAACANLGSLFAARAADRAKEIALRMALGSRRGLILRQLLTEAMVVSAAGGFVGLASGIVILRWMSAWQPIPDIPINVPVNPDVWTYLVALLLAVVSGLLFGMVPVRQVLKSDPWQVIRAGGLGSDHLRRFSLRDLLLVGQIAICAVLVTSSLVAVRGLARSLHSDFGFQPENTVLASTDLKWAGYATDKVPEMQRRMLDTAAAIPGVSAAGLIDNIPLSLGSSDSFVYKDSITDFRPTNFAADAMNYDVSPGYFAAAGTRLLAGRDLTWHDADKQPVVAVVNQEFARKVFGSADRAIGGYFKFWGGQRAQVVGIVENGKYRTLTEDQQPAMFFPILQHASSSTVMVVRSRSDAAGMAEGLEKRLRGLDPTMPMTIATWNRELGAALFAARVATVALGVLGLLGGMLAVTGIFGMASYSVSKRLRELGIRVALGAGQKEVLRAALGRAFVVMAAGSVAGLVLGILATKVLSYIVYQATPKDPVVLGGVVVSMLVLGLLAAWIPAQRALGVDPMILLRDE
ncbi:MAG TPA: ABC transporter permease [Acidobacteriaceae bacterium]|jgi:predicted permease|nr:ABC transporter permease [Acidobacteriaceae bacterium]